MSQEGAETLVIYLASEQHVRAKSVCVKTIFPFLLLCVVAAWIPLHLTPAKRDESVFTFLGWASAPLPHDLTPVLPKAPEGRFAVDFPGKKGVFTDWVKTYAVRWVHTPTRKLHPAADCLPALGYDISPAPIFITADGSRWGTSNAQRGTEQFRVSERITDSTGREWTNVSAWFWSARFGHSVGPWWAVTVFEPVSVTSLP